MSWVGNEKLEGIKETIQLTSTNRRQHSYRVPDRILTKKQHRLSFLHAILLDQSSVQIRCVILDLGPIDPFFGNGICVAGPFTGRIPVQWRVVLGFEQPFPDGYVSRDYEFLSMSTEVQQSAEMAGLGGGGEILTIDVGMG